MKPPILVRISSRCRGNFFALLWGLWGLLEQNFPWTISPVLCPLLCSMWATGRGFGSASARPVQPPSGIWSNSSPLKKGVKLVQSLQGLRVPPTRTLCNRNSPPPPPESFSLSLQQWASALKRQLLMFLPVVMSHRAERCRRRMFVCTTQGNFECAVVLFWLP